MRMPKMPIALCLLLCACAQGLPQEIKSVKGGHGQGGFQYNATANLVRRFNENGTLQHQGGPHNLSRPLDFEKGVCYIEVPTATLAKDPTHIPAGNGSRPDLSRIRTCCRGFIRNIHNFKICDPVCTNECINGLCTDPDVCTCYPDHVRNVAGFCIPTCPLGCQNGNCAGGECLCKDGYKLDADSKYCVPVCKGNCAGIGNCTEPNTCDCKPGFKSTVDGSCAASCDHCTNGDCVAPNDCRCHQGYQKNEFGECVPSCPNGCGPTGQCIAPNVCSCPIGFDRDSATNQCIPKCSQPCLNGVCAGGNTCNCNPGYNLDRSDPKGSRCLPSCPGGCPNGTCSGPNFCICNMGFVKDRSVKGRQTCVKRVRRSANLDQQNIEEKPDVAAMLVFDIPDY